MKKRKANLPSWPHCNCKRTRCVEKRCSCVRSGHMCSPETCGCTSGLCLNRSDSVLHRPPQQPPSLAEPQPMAAEADSTVSIRITRGACGDSNVFRVPKDCKFAVLAEESALFWNIRRERMPRLFGTDGAAMPPGQPVCCIPTAVAHGLVLSETDSAGVDGLTVEGTPSTPPTVPERVPSPLSLGDLAVAPLDSPRLTRSGEGSGFPYRGRGCQQRFASLPPSAHGAVHICGPGCVSVISQGGTVTHVDRSTFGGGDPPCRVCGEFVVTCGGKVFVCKSPADGAVSFTEVSIPTVKSVSHASATETEYLVIDSDTGKLWAMSKTTPLPYEAVTSEGFRFVGVESCMTMTIAVDSRGTAHLLGDVSEMGLGLRFTTAVDIPPTIGCSRRVVSASCGQCHVLLLSDDGSVMAFGNGDEGRLGLGDTNPRLTPTVVRGMGTVKEISCGRFHSAAVTDAGELFTWGNGKFGQLGHGAQSHELAPKCVTMCPRITSVACEMLSTVAIDVFGTAFSFGFRTTPSGVEGYSVDVLGTLPRAALQGREIVAVSASQKEGFFLALHGRIAAEGGSLAAPINL